MPEMSILPKNNYRHINFTAHFQDFLFIRLLSLRSPLRKQIMLASVAQEEGVTYAQKENRWGRGQRDPKKEKKRA